MISIFLHGKNLHRLILPHNHEQHYINDWLWVAPPLVNLEVNELT